MLRIELAQLKPGMKLALPVRHPRFLNQTLLKYGFELEPQIIERLRQLGIHSVWVQYPALDFLAKLQPTGLLNAQGKVVEQVAQVFETVQPEAIARLPFHDYVTTLSEMVHQLIANPAAAVFMGDLAEYSEDDMLRHASTVTYLSLLMGLKLETYVIRQRRHIVDATRAKEIVSMGLGAMLHDVGVTQLAEDVRKRYRETGNDSDAQWREHPSVGYEMVRGRVDPSAATVVLNHHQRYDGSGYAGHSVPVLEGPRIHIFARIVALADVFDRLHRPVGKPPAPTVAVLRALLTPALFRQFDPEVIRALLTVVPPYAPGTIVKLTTGEDAVVIDHDPADPCRPTVQLIPDLDRFHALATRVSANGVIGSADNDATGRTIELSKQIKSLAIARAGGHDVAKYNFPAPDLMHRAAAG